MILPKQQILQGPVELPGPATNTVLTTKETEVVQFLNKGLSNREIALQMNVTEKTVKFHLTNVYRKLGVKSRTQLIAKELGAGTPAQSPSYAG